MPSAAQRQLLLAALLLIAVASRAEVPAAPPRRELLASGDVVAPLGRVGRFSAELRGIDDRGRLLVAADLSDGSAALYWLDEHGVESLPTATGQATLFPATSVSSPAGRVAVRGVRPGERSNPPATVFVLEGGEPRPVLSLGDTTVEGLHVVVMNDLTAIGDDGTVVVLAGVARDPGPPLPGEWYNAVVAVDAAGARVVAGSGDRYGSWPIGVTAAGEVVFSAYTDGRLDAIYAAGAGGTRRLVGSGDRLPSGRRLREVGALAVSPAGEILFRGCKETAAEYAEREDCAIYRTRDGRVVRVVGPDDRTPDGALFDSWEGFINTGGDVVLRASWLAPCDDTPGGLCDVDYGLLYVPAGGGIAQVGRGARGGWLNASAAVATTTGDDVGRWRAGAATTLLHRDDPAPGGAAFRARGLEDGPGEYAVCVAADGRVGAVATFADGGQAVVCIDGEGPHAVLSSRDPLLDDPQLGATGFWPRAQCDFADGDEMYVAAGGKVFRATTAAGIERVIGGEDPSRGGAYWWLGEPDTHQVFSVNRHGTVVVVDGDDILRRRRDGPLEVVHLPLRGLDEVFEAEVADDESIVATLRLWDDPGGATGPAARVVRLDGAGLHLIARRGPPHHRSPAVLGGAPQNLAIAGGRVGFVADRRDYGPWPLLAELGGGAPRELLAGPDLPAAGYLIDLAADGSVLLDTDYYGYGRFLFDGARLARLSEEDDFADRELEPVALGAPYLVLFQERRRGRQSLSLSGPPASGRCPRVAVAAPPSPTPTATVPRRGADSDGCAVGPASPTSWWLFAGAALLAAARRRRRARSRRRRC